MLMLDAGREGTFPRCLSLCLTICALEIQKNPPSSLLPLTPNLVFTTNRGNYLLNTCRQPADNVAKFLRCNPPKKASLNSWHLLLQRWQSLGITGGGRVVGGAYKTAENAFDTSLVMHFTTSLTMHAGADG